MPRITSLASLALVLGAALGLGYLAVATEEPAGLVAGRVRDRAGNALGTSLLRFEGDDGTRRDAIASPRGDFRLRLPEGRYRSVAASHSYMPARTADAFRVGEGGVTRLWFSLARPGDPSTRLRRGWRQEGGSQPDRIASTVTVIQEDAKSAAFSRPGITLSWEPGWPAASPGLVSGSWIVRDAQEDPFPGAAVKWRAVAGTSPGHPVGRGEIWTDDSGLAPLRFRPRLGRGASASIMVIAEARDDLGTVVRAEAQTVSGGSQPVSRASAPVPFLPLPRLLRSGDVPVIAGRRFDPSGIPVLPAGREIGQAWAGELSRPVSLSFTIPPGTVPGMTLLRVDAGWTPLSAAVMAEHEMRSRSSLGNDATASRLLAASSLLRARLAGLHWWHLRPAALNAVADLARGQNPDGGWGWWPGLASLPDLTALALRAIEQARMAGVPVGARVAAARQYLVRAARAGVAEPADAVWALGAAAPGDLRERAWSRRKTFGTAALGRLAEGLVRAADSRALGALAELDLRAVESTASAYWPGVPADALGREWDGSDVEATAQAILAHVAAGMPEEPVPEAVRWLLLARRGHTFGGIRATAVAAAALAAAPSGDPDRPVEATIVLDEKPLPRLPGTAGNPFATVAGSGRLPAGRHDLLLAAPDRDTPRVAVFTASLKYRLPDLPAGPAVHKAIEIERRYRVVDNSRLSRAGGRSLMHWCRPRESDRLPLLGGSRLRLDRTAIVRLTLRVRQSLRFVRITDPIPAGGAAVRLPPDPAFHLTTARPDVVTFDIPALEPGTHEFAYALRPRVAGTYLAAAPTVEAVHQPDIRARGTARLVEIE